ncbi:MAG: hypothetical protein K8R73_08365 [Clostridiales bacterium]|nr:hypothetical protein [Clostridiales bacterium]
MFIRRKTRLNTDVINALRMLSSIERIQKWTTDIPEHIEKMTDNHVVWKYDDFDKQSIIFEFYLMQCTQKTEYCTEIQLLLKTIDEKEPPNESATHKAESVLENIRFKFNQSWIIEDKDLNSSLLKTR